MGPVSAEEQAIVRSVAEFVDRDVRPKVKEFEHADRYPASFIQQMADMGVFGLLVPSDHNGIDVSASCFALVTEELARGWMSLAGAMGGHSVVTVLLRRFGTPEQQERYLPRMASGDLRATMALTEPGGGSNLQAMRTTAAAKNGHFVVNGSKMWITNAERAGLTALMVKTDPDAEPAYEGISILLAEKGSGFEVSRPLSKLGYKGVETCELVFDGYEVPSRGSARLRGGAGLPPDDGWTGDRPDTGRGTGREGRTGGVR